MTTNGFQSIRPARPPVAIPTVHTTALTIANLQTTKITLAHTQDTRPRRHRVPKSANSEAKVFRSLFSSELVCRAVSTRSSVQTLKAGAQAGTPVPVL